LNVLLAAAGKRIVPKRVLTHKGWQPAPFLVPRLQGRAREYNWDVSDYAGRRVQIVIGDLDSRPGCHVFCSGFRIVPRTDKDNRSFSSFMVRLTEACKMAPPVRYESRHFTALGSADDQFTRLRLNNCELIYQLFFEHFQRHGIVLHKPKARLMVAIFDS
jgi:hypothetical protein